MTDKCRGLVSMGAAVGIQNDTALGRTSEPLLDLNGNLFTTCSGKPFFTTFSGQKPLCHIRVILKHVF